MPTVESVVEYRGFASVVDYLICKFLRSSILAPGTSEPFLIASLIAVLSGDGSGIFGAFMNSDGMSDWSRISTADDER